MYNLLNNARNGDIFNRTYISFLQLRFQAFILSLKVVVKIVSIPDNSSYHDRCIGILEKNLNLNESVNYKEPDWTCPWCVYAKQNEIENERDKERLNQCFNVIIRGTFLSFSNFQFML